MLSSFGGSATELTFRFFLSGNLSLGFQALKNLRDFFNNPLPNFLPSRKSPPYSEGDHVVFIERIENLDNLFTTST